MNIEFSEKLFLLHSTYSNAICYCILYAKIEEFQIGQKDFGFISLPFDYPSDERHFLKENIEPLEYNET